MAVIEMNEQGWNGNLQHYKYCNAVIDEETGKMMELRDLLKHPKYQETWTRACSNEFGRLFQSVGKNADMQYSPQ